VLSLWVAQRSAIPGLVTALASAGCQIYRVSPQEPTLEDVYFALHEGAVPSRDKESHEPPSPAR
jgi:ABC-2 type transport system ATP-binding protein